MAVVSDRGESFVGDSPEDPPYEGVRSPLRNGECLRCVFDKDDPVIHDIGFLQAYSDLQTPDRRERVEASGNNLMTPSAQHVRVWREYELAIEASIVRDRLRWRTQAITGVLPDRAPQPQRHWEQEGFDWADYEFDDDPDRLLDYCADCEWAEVVDTVSTSQTRKLPFSSAISVMPRLSQM